MQTLATHAVTRTGPGNATATIYTCPAHLIATIAQLRAAGADTHRDRGRQPGPGLQGLRCPLASHETDRRMSILLVQHASNTGTGSTLDVTLGANATANNCLAVAAGSAASGAQTVSGITLGGSADNFAKAKSLTEGSVVDCELWTDQGLTKASEAVVVTWSGSPSDGGAAVASEWSGVKTSSAVDKTNSGAAATTSWSSGASGTLSQAAEVILGAVCCFTLTTVTITGPGSPWTNFAQAADSIMAVMCGYIITSATTIGDLERDAERQHRGSTTRRSSSPWKRRPAPRTPIPPA